jgi:cytoplasmic iron level regulating protein YaaA (DUF328/UPF0246 family)
MITLLSPAKSLDFESPAQTKEFSQPEMLEDSAYLNNKLRKLSAGQIQKLMGVNADIATLNHERFNTWQLPFTDKNAKQAILAFRGDVYRGLDAPNWNEDDLKFAQEHVRILSGLYGLLKPLDLMQAYRLEMGTRFKVTPKVTNLYKFWGNKITDKLLTHLDDDVIINLASNEYFKSIKTADINKRIITCHFKDLKNGEYKSLMTYAKLGRGYMTRYIVQNRINDPEEIKGFNLKKYSFNAPMSQENEWVFTRDEVEL